MSEHPLSEHLPVTGLDEWSQLCSTAYVPLRVAAEHDFQGALRARDLGPLSLSQVGATPSTIRRDTRLVRADPREALLFSVFLRGTSLVTQQGPVAQVHAGGAYVLDTDRPYGIGLQTANDVLILRVPSELADLAPADLATIAGRPLPPRTDEVAVLCRELAAALLPRDAAQESDDEEDRQQLLLDLLAATTHRMQYGDRSRPYLSGAALWASARWYVDRHHADPRLTVDALADRFMVSRRHLELQFARHGIGPSAYLRHARGDRARRILLADRSATIERVAHDSGFSDTNTFIRAFRRQHGQNPASWRRRQPRSSAGSPEHASDSTDAGAESASTSVPALLSDLRWAT